MIDIRIDDANGYEYTEASTANASADFPAFSNSQFVDFDLSWDATSGGQPIITIVIDGQQVQDPFPAEAGDVTTVEAGLQTIQFRFAGNSATDAPDIGLFVDDFMVFDASGAVLFSDDFEGYSLGASLDPDENGGSPYHPNTSDSDVLEEICEIAFDPTEIPEECNLFAFVSDVSDDDTGELRFTLPEVLPAGRMTVLVNKTFSGEDAFVNLSGTSTSRRNSIIDIRIDDNNGYEYTEATTAQGSADFPSFTNNQFIEFDLSWDATAGGQPIVTVVIDGQQVQAPFSAESQDVSTVEEGVRTVQFRFAGNSAVAAATRGLLVDDLMIFDASGNVLFADDFESYTVGNSLNPNDNGASPYHPNTSDASIDVDLICLAMQDTDMDGVSDLDDCNPADPAIAFAPGDACDDGDPNLSLIHI